MKVSKKGKNPGAVDFWLDSLGYFRKNVAYDETCLFRAISEQLKSTQLHHEEIRKTCITFGKRNMKLFKDLVPVKRDWFERLQQLSVHMLICNEIEIQLICETYVVDIVMFIGATQQVREFKCESLFKHKTLYICKTSEDHYDAVYTKTHIENAGFCQSIVYSIVYENVFEVPDVPGIVHKMLHDKDSTCVIYCSDTGRESGGEEDEAAEESNAMSFYNPNIVAPFPFKIAKALDPDMYRNIEYDTWLEIRRDLRLGDWYYGDNRFIHGARCLVTRNGRDYVCYVQNIKHKQNLCEVYVMECGQRWTVNYAELRPEADAKPWPLPYRFTKSLALQLPSAASHFDGDRKTLRKRREKKHFKVEKNEEMEEATTSAGVENFRGCPLLMHSISKDGSDKAMTTNDNLESGLDENSNSVTLEPLHWQSPLLQEDLFSNMAAALPHPNDSPVFYQDSDNSQYYSNYNGDFNYQSPVVWPTPQYVYTPDSVTSDMRSPFPDFNRSTPKLFYYPTDMASPNYLSPPVTFPPPPSIPPLTPQYPPTDKVICNTPLIQTPHIDMYPVMYPVQPPSTPVYYSHPPSPIPATRPAECSNGSAMPVYNSPMDIQYMTPPTYLFPPTPPVAWYSPHVNAQGFIYPTAYNN